MKQDDLYAKYVRDKAGYSQLYRDILDELLKSPRTKKINHAKNEDDFATIEIGTNWLCSYIVQLVNDTISYVGGRNGREESEDIIREGVGLSNLTKYKGEFKKLVEEHKKRGELEEDD